MKKKTSLLFLSVFVLIYLFYFGLISIMKFNSFSYYDFDLAVHDLAVWNLMHGSVFNSILGIPFLGNHMHLIMFLIVPVYIVFNHPITLLLLQTVALGITAFPIYLLSRRLLDDNWALIISIAYLFYPALGYTNLFEFHPTVFATFFLAVTIYYYALNSFPKFIIFLILSMICQENISLAGIMFGVLAIFNKRKLKWIITPMLAGALYFFIALSLMSHFNNNTIQFIAIYGHLGNSPSRILLNILTNPQLLIKTLFRAQSFIYLLHIFLPVAFLPLLSPLTLIPALPFFLQHLLSARISELTILYHYAAEIIPFIFAGVIFAVQFLLKNKRLKKYQIYLKISLLSVLFVSNIFFGPHFAILRRINFFKKDYLDLYKDSFLAKIPPKASVVATFEFLPHLSHRSNLYSFHHVYMGFYTISNKKYELPQNVQYALIDFNDFLTFRSFYSPDNYKNIQKFLAEANWQAEGLIDSIVLFKKNIPAKYTLCEILQDVPSEIANKMEVNIENEIQLIGYNLSSLDKEDILDIVFYWRSLKPTDKDINVFLDIVDENNQVVMRKVFPICYRIFPTNSWQEGQTFKDQYRIKIPSGFFKGNYELKMGFFDFRNNIVCKVSKDTDEFGRVFLIVPK